ncbi:MAG: TetR family transcriptional regulator, partial [Solirubrobacteraceae bacterium]
MSPAGDPPPRSGGRGARGRILAAARVLFHRHGINATGVAELCAAAPVTN